MADRKVSMREAEQHLADHEASLLAGERHTYTLEVVLSGHPGQYTREEIDDFLRWRLGAPDALDLNDVAVDLSAVTVARTRLI